MTNLDRSLDSFFSDLKNIVGLQFSDLMSEVGITLPERGPGIPLLKLGKLADRLNITIDSIFLRQVDYPALKAQLEGRSILPARYLGTEYSSRFSSIYMFNFMVKNFGKSSADLIRQRFQLKDSHFENIKDRNNILLPSDLCDYIHQYYGLDVVEGMGESSLDLFAASGMSRDFKHQVKQSDYFDFFFNELLPSSVEKNYQWKIHSQGPGFLEVRGLACAEVIESLGSKNVITPPLEALRKGFLKSIPKLFFTCTAKVHMAQSMSGGDNCDLYRLDYNQIDKSPAYLQ